MDQESINGNYNAGCWATPGDAYDGDGTSWTRIQSLRTDYLGVRPYLDVQNYIDYMLLFLFGGCENEWRSTGPKNVGSGAKYFLNDADGYLPTAAYATSQTGNKATARSNPNAGRLYGDGPGSVFSQLWQQGHIDFKMLLADRNPDTGVASKGIDWFGNITNNSASVQTLGINLYMQSGTRTLAATSNAHTDWNSGARDLVLVGRNGGAMRTLFSFDFAGVPADATIPSAKLDLWTSSSSGIGIIGALELRTLSVTPVEGTGIGDGTSTHNGTGTGAAWLLRTPTNAWTAAGGDFSSTVLSTLAGYDATITGTQRTLVSTAAFVAAVQSAAGRGAAAQSHPQRDQRIRRRQRLHAPRERRRGECERAPAIHAMRTASRILWNTASAPIRRAAISR